MLDMKCFVLPAENMLNRFINVRIAFKLPTQIKDSIVVCFVLFLSPSPLPTGERAH